MSDLRKRSPLCVVLGRMAVVAGLAGIGAGLPGCTANGLGELSEAVTHPELPSMPSLVPDFSGFTIRSTPVKEARVITPADYMDAQGNCAAPPPAPEGTEAPTGVALEMTECDIVHALGAPSRVEIGSDERGRSVVATYTQGSRPGIYRFSEGQLRSIERVAEAAPEPKAKKKPAPRARRSSNT